MNYHDLLLEPRFPLRPRAPARRNLKGGAASATATASTSSASDHQEACGVSSCVRERGREGQVVTRACSGGNAIHPQLLCVPFMRIIRRNAVSFGPHQSPSCFLRASHTDHEWFSDAMLKTDHDFRVGRTDCRLETFTEDLDSFGSGRRPNMLVKLRNVRTRVSNIGAVGNLTSSRAFATFVILFATKLVDCDLNAITAHLLHELTEFGIGPWSLVHPFASRPTRTITSLM